jgi:hypothetical protein
MNSFASRSAAGVPLRAKKAGRDFGIRLSSLAVLG